MEKKEKIGNRIREIAVIAIVLYFSALPPRQLALLGSQVGPSLCLLTEARSWLGPRLAFGPTAELPFQLGF